MMDAELELQLAWFWLIAAGLLLAVLAKFLFDQLRPGG